MNEPYSIFIVSAEKDWVLTKYLLQSIQKNLYEYDDIHFVVSEKERFLDYISVSCPWVHNISAHNEIDVLQMDLSKVKYRPNWIYQQYLKMFQNVTRHNLYLTVDADVIFIKPFPLFSDGKRILYSGWQQNHRPYFEFQELMFDLPRDFDSTFISDTNFFDKKLIDELLHGSGYTQETFIEKSIPLIHGPFHGGCYPAEPEIWGQYLMKHHSDLYTVRQLKTLPIGKPVSGISQSAWGDSEIEEQLAIHAEYDLISLHSWYDQKV